MARKKVEICGVNTSSLPLLSEEEKEDLFERIEQGDLLANDFQEVVKMQMIFFKLAASVL